MQLTSFSPMNWKCILEPKMGLKPTMPTRYAQFHVSQGHLLRIYSNCCVQLMVEELYVLSVLEEEEARKNDLLEKFIKVAVDNSDHLQPGYDMG